GGLAARDKPVAAGQHQPVPGEEKLGSKGDRRGTGGPQDRELQPGTVDQTDRLNAPDLVRRVRVDGPASGAKQARADERTARDDGLSTIRAADEGAELPVDAQLDAVDPQPGLEADRPGPAVRPRREVGRQR